MQKPCELKAEPARLDSCQVTNRAFRNRVKPSRKSNFFQKTGMPWGCKAMGMQIGNEQEGNFARFLGAEKVCNGNTAEPFWSAIRECPAQVSPLLLDWLKN